jgi:ATP-dependent helicase/nuclease subunit A
MTSHDDANISQIRASDPDNSTWVSANAGSGKTKVLTDRVARLLLAGTDPQKILCLTYTKAAASHMQNKLFQRLGSWAMLQDVDLIDELGQLSLGERSFTAADLMDARRLFARALETPGGLKIQTIHSFCASLLRRFPLEAGVSPQFGELDDRNRKLMFDDLLDEMASQDDNHVFLEFANQVHESGMHAALQDICKDASVFGEPADWNKICTGFAFDPSTTQQDIFGPVLHPSKLSLVKQVAELLVQGSTRDRTAGEKLLGINASGSERKNFDILTGVLLTGDTATPFSAKIGAFGSKATLELVGDQLSALILQLDALMLDVEAARDQDVRFSNARASFAVHNFACQFIARYEAAKRAKSVLYYDDQINKARQLLAESNMASWVLYRLDGGLDHILVDEAQDTSPSQWDVVRHLAGEFTSGLSSRDDNRTLFVVGDEKQSIYSFQGADPDAFADMRTHFANSLSAAGEGLATEALQFSFRSANTILRVVDTVMAAATSKVSAGTNHRAYHDTLPGRVDIWPFAKKEKREVDFKWWEPSVTLDQDQTINALAQNIACEIQDMLNAGHIVGSQHNRHAINAGDIVILVRRRGTLFHAIIRALKNADLAVAGADRLKIAGEMAVKDLTALLAFLSTPEDDLSLAAVLRSPLCGLTEGDLFTLCNPRPGYLWQSMRENANVFPEAYTFLKDLRDNAEFLRPFELLERALTHHSKRTSLVARLGFEATDGINALLDQALAFERENIPSLTTFLMWIEHGDVELKRQMDTESTQIRVMTVHGAKGLEAPVVILPDTAATRPRPDGMLVSISNKIVAVSGSKATRSLPLQEAAEKQRAKREAEDERLLYVAMTRAENWLIVCGAGDLGKPEKPSWYQRIQSGLEDMDATPHDFAAGTGSRVQNGTWEQQPDSPTQHSDPSALPVWMSAPVPPQATPVVVLSPSDLGGAKVVPGTQETSEHEALQYGSAVHLLLEHLPTSEPDQKYELARTLLEQNFVSSEFDFSAVTDEAVAVLNSPELAKIFDADTLAEVPISCPVGDAFLNGVIDRLIVQPDRVLAVDFKSNTKVPETVGEVPDGILRQMAAYEFALKRIYPTRQIDVAVLWTKTAHLMQIPNEIVTRALDWPTAP